MTSTSTVVDPSPALDTLLKKSQGQPLGSLLPDELSSLIIAFSPTQAADVRSKAYLALSAFCQGVRRSSPVKGKQPDPATETLVKIFEPPIRSRLEDTEESSLLLGASFLSALFQVDWETASSIFQTDGILEYVMDTVDLKPSSQMCQCVAHLLGQACGHKSCRAILTPHVVEWLESKSRQTTDINLCAASVVALIKLSRGSVADNSETTGVETNPIEGKNEELADVMKHIVTSGAEQSSIADAVEGLAYLSVDPVIKEQLTLDSVFLTRLFALVPKKAITPAQYNQPLTTLLFGILVIISNLCAYRPRLTEEQAHVEKLRRIAKAGKDVAQASDRLRALDDDKNVKIRARRLVASGVLEAIVVAVSGKDSVGIRLNAGKALLSIIEDNDNRGRVLQSGGAKTLVSIIKYATPLPEPSGSASTLDANYLESIQALAKLAITSSPLQVFGPNEGAMYDVIRPLSLMLQHPSSTLLQRFEAIMALTNLSSHSAELATRIAQAEGLMNKVELLLLEEHVLIRRASIELICNLIAGSDDVFERYGGENAGGVKSKIQVVLALTDVDDLPTRLAASGALATLTTSSGACRALIELQVERRRVFSIITQLIDPTVEPSEPNTEEGPEQTHPGLLHRGIVCTLNLFSSIEDKDTLQKLSKDAKDAGLLQALIKIMKSQENDVIQRPTAEILKLLLVDNV